MLSIDLIRDNLRQSEAIVLSRIEEMREHGLVRSTPNGGCHTVWVLGHLAFIEAMVIQAFMLGRANPLASWERVFDGEEISGDPDLFPSFDRVLEECRSVRRSTITLLDTFREDDLDEKSLNVPAAAVELFGTRRQCFQYVADHWFMHRGQLADARRAAGIARMWY